MRIAIDARKLHDYGIGTYVRNLLRHLSRLDSESEYLVICDGEDGPLAGELGPNFRAVTTGARAESAFDQFTVPRLLKQQGVRLYHTPYPVLPVVTV